MFYTLYFTLGILHLVWCGLVVWIWPCIGWNIGMEDIVGNDWLPQHEVINQVLSETIILFWRMSDDDPWSYTPLKVTKRRKRKPEGCQKKKKRKESEDVGIKEEVKEGIVEVFAGTRRRPSLVDETPSGFRSHQFVFCVSRWPILLLSSLPSVFHFYLILPVCPLCRLPLHLLTSGTMATPRVHIQGCMVLGSVWMSNAWHWIPRSCVGIILSGSCFE